MSADKVIEELPPSHTSAGSDALCRVVDPSCQSEGGGEEQSVRLDSASKREAPMGGEEGAACMGRGGREQRRRRRDSHRE